MKYLLFIIIPSLALSWNTPINLSRWSGNDLNPQVCRSWNFGSYTCLVWQRLGPCENWNIVARFSTSVGEWDTITTVIADSGSDDENPAVCYDQRRNKVWVAWQKNVGNWEIYVAQGDPSGFDSSYQLTNSPDCRDENPSVFVISDTVWVTWQSSSAIDTITRILAKFYDGTNWSNDFIIDQSRDPFCTNPKINNRHNHPIIVYRKWSRCFSHIYFSEYLNNLWTAPAVVCDSSGYNYNPEVIGGDLLGSPFGGVFILWDNLIARDIFRTAYDTFNLHYRITEDTTVVDICPSALNYGIPTLSFPPMCIAWQREDDIYSKLYSSPEFISVDTDSCRKPCLTAMGSTCLWCVYQKNVGGNWEIFGTYEAYGIEEKQSNQIKAKRLISFNQLASFLRDKRYQVYDITGRVIKNNTDLRSGIYFLKIDEEKISAVFIR